MSKLTHKRHNVSILMYHIVCPAKYRRAIFTPEVVKALTQVCLEIEKRFEIEFLEIGTDQDHVHFFVQSVPSYSPSKIVRVIKSLTAREIFRQVASVKQQLWGGELWADGYYISTVGRYAGEEQIRHYVQKQGTAKSYKQILVRQLSLF
jgi:REP element-mobilizing transposase RayT